MEKLKKYRADFAFWTYFCDLLNTATANPLINSGDAVLVVYDAQIVEVKEYTSDVAESAVLKMTPKQIRAKALE